MQEKNKDFTTNKPISKLLFIHHWKCGEGNRGTDVYLLLNTVYSFIVMSSQINEGLHM